MQIQEWEVKDFGLLLGAGVAIAKIQVQEWQSPASKSHHGQEIRQLCRFPLMPLTASKIWSRTKFKIEKLIYEKFKNTDIHYKFKNWKFPKFPANLESMHFFRKILRAAKINPRSKSEI